MGKVLVILGHFQQAGINAWGIVKALRDAGYDVTEREQCINQGPGPNVVGLGDILDADVIYCYSHGLASLLYCTLGFSVPIKCRLLVVVLGVPNAAGVGGWDLLVPSEIERVICWQVTPDKAVPVSVPVKPLDGKIENEIWADWGDPNGEAWITAKTPGPAPKPYCPRVNINCDALAAGMLPVQAHCEVPNNPDLIAAQVRIHAELSASWSSVKGGA